MKTRFSSEGLHQRKINDATKHLTLRKTREIDGYKTFKRVMNESRACDQAFGDGHSVQLAHFLDVQADGRKRIVARSQPKYSYRWLVNYSFVTWVRISKRECIICTNPLIFDRFYLLFLPALPLGREMWQ